MSSCDGLVPTAKCSHVLVLLLLQMSSCDGPIPNANVCMCSSGPVPNENATKF